MRAVSALQLLDTEDFFQLCFGYIYIYIYMPTEQVGSTINASAVHFEDAWFE
jgi:hypothetical protein